MIPADITHILRTILAPAICGAVIVIGLIRRGGDRSRRWILISAGALGTFLTLATIVICSEVRIDTPKAGIQFLLGVALLLPAGVMVFIGKRGRRVGDHPVCRKCDFDLFGKPPESDRCSECGADLRSPSAVAIGFRRLRSRWILGGVFTFCLALMLSAQPAYDYARSIDYYRYRPTNWLIADLKSPKRNQAFDALYARLEKAVPGDAEAQQIASAFLREVDSGRDLPSEWELLSLISKRDLFDEQTTRRILRDIILVDRLDVAPMMGIGRPICLNSYIPPQTAGMRAFRPGWHSRIMCEVFDERYQIGTVQLPSDSARWIDQPWDDPIEQKSVVLNPGEAWQRLQPGDVMVSRAGTLRVSLDYRGGTISEIVPFSKQSASLIVPLEKAMPRLVEPDDMDLSATWSAEVSSINGTPILKLRRSQGDNRILARVSLIDDPARLDIGTVELEGGSLSACVSAPMPLNIPVGKVQLELTPAPVEAVGTWNTGAILNQVIRIGTIQRF